MTTQTKQQPYLTTDHPSCSYGQPVLIIDGLAYGPGDHVPGVPVNTTARDCVDFFYSSYNSGLADKFLSIKF